MLGSPARTQPAEYSAVSQDGNSLFILQFVKPKGASLRFCININAYLQWPIYKDARLTLSPFNNANLPPYIDIFAKCKSNMKNTQKCEQISCALISSNSSQSFSKTYYLTDFIRY